MTTKWGQRWTGATLGPGGTKFGGALRAEKRNERGWAKKHQGKVREVSKYVQVFRSLFFYNERFKTWRLMDCQGVFYKAREKLGNRGWVQKAPVVGQQALTQVCWTKLSGLLGSFHSTALLYWLCNAFFNKIVSYRTLWKSVELNFDLPTPKMLSPYSLCCCRLLFQNVMYLKSIVFLPSNQAYLISTAKSNAFRLQFLHSMPQRFSY